VSADVEVRAVLLDVEGTTTPLAFVAETLFPYARARMEAFLTEHAEDVAVRADALALAAEAEREPGAPPVDAADPSSVAAFALRLMDCDRKSTPLKSLQGRIWEDGYRSGELASVVFDDVPRALERWSARGLDVAIFSSGSRLAQRLLFEHTGAGDLTPYVREYFDTNVGPKTEAASYARVAEALGRAPDEILFVSDVRAELDAASASGMRVALAVRPGNRPAELSGVARIASFDELFAD
jgi:enolase-phosphatase E1